MEDFGYNPNLYTLYHSVMESLVATCGGRMSASQLTCVIEDTWERLGKKVHTSTADPHHSSLQNLPDMTQVFVANPSGRIASASRATQTFLAAPHFVCDPVP